MCEVYQLGLPRFLGRYDLVTGDKQSGMMGYTLGWAGVVL